MSVIDDYSPQDITCEPIRDRLTVIVQWYDDFWSEYFAGAAGETVRLMTAISELEEGLSGATEADTWQLDAPLPAPDTPAPYAHSAPCPSPVEPVAAYQPVSLVTGQDMLDIFSMPAPCYRPAPAPTAIPVSVPAPV